jgi:hypothetical protein
VFKLRVSERMHVVDFLSFHHVKVNSLGGGTWGDNFPFCFLAHVGWGVVDTQLSIKFLFWEGIRKDSFDSNVTKQQLL